MKEFLLTFFRENRELFMTALSVAALFAAEGGRRHHKRMKAKRAAIVLENKPKGEENGKGI